MADTTYVVTAPLVVARNNQQGGRHEYLYQGTVVPASIGKEEIDRLLEAELIAKTGDEDTGVTPVTSPDQLNTEMLVPAGEPSAPEPEPERESGTEPPHGNAGRDAWAAYAASLGVDVPADASRDDIKALVAAKQ